MRKLAPIIAMTAALVAGAALSIERATAINPIAAARPGMPAPVFSASDISGRTISLGDYAGKIVILEWTNDGCPFVGKILACPPAAEFGGPNRGLAAERQGNLAAYFPIILQQDLIIAIDFIIRKLWMRVRRDPVRALHTERECFSLALWG